MITSTSVAEAYRVRIATRNVTTVDGNVALTLGLADMSDIPQFSAQEIDPTKWEVQSGGGSAHVIDHGEQITGILADPATGRAWLLGRLIDVQRQVDGGAWSTIHTGRLADVQRGEDPNVYGLYFQDERLMERRTKLFKTTDTISVYPSGLRYRWALFDGTRPVPFYPSTLPDFGANPGTITAIGIDINPQWSAEVRMWLRSLLVDKPERGQNNYPGVWAYDEAAGRYHGIEYIGHYNEEWSEGLDQPLGKTLRVGLVQTADVTLGNAGALNFQWDDVEDRFIPRQMQIITVDAEISEAAPRHLGVDNPAHEYGTDGGGIPPFELLKRAYDSAGVRYNAAAMAELTGLLTYSAYNVRQKRAVTLEELADTIYAAHSVVPLLDNSGAIKPTSLRLPYGVSTADIATWVEITHAKLRRVESLQHPSADVINSVTAHYSKVRARWWGEAEEGVRYGADGLVETAGAVSLDHDTLGAGGVPERGLDLHYIGYPDLGDSIPISILPIPPHFEMTTNPSFRREFSYAVREVFDRFGDGPFRGMLYGNEELAALEPGDYARLNLDTFPNLATQALGGTRLIQILTRVPVPGEGYDFQYIDIGPNQGKLDPPTVSVALNAVRPWRIVDITVTGLAATERAVVMAQYNGDPTWEVVDVWDADGVKQFPGRKRGAAVRVFGFKTSPHRIRSDDSAIASVTTSGFTLPSGLSVSAITSRTAALTWTPGQTDEFTEVLLVEGPSPASWDHADAVDILEPGADEYELELGTASQQYTVGVRHKDRFGGTSTVIESTFSTTATRPIVSRPAGMVIIETSGLVAE